MIYPKTYYECKCDNCGKVWYNYDESVCALVDEISLKQQISDDGWDTRQEISDNMVEVDKHYCADCWYYDDEDNFCLKEVNNER